MKKFNIYIKEDKWEIQLLSSKEYEKAFGTDSWAITGTLERIIAFRTDKLAWRFIIHELYHAYYFYSYCNSSTAIDIEETNAELLGNDFQHILKKALTVYNKLSKMTTSPISGYPFKSKKLHTFI